MLALQHRQKRAMVIVNLGNPESTCVISDGQAVKRFVLHFGNEPGVGRAGQPLRGAPAERPQTRRHSPPIILPVPTPAPNGAMVIGRAPFGNRRPLA